ncbi:MULTISPECIES: YihY/virulence factor BrkB family protein [Frankia]|nr:MULTISPECIES: YihY/virulence factor BrkB family protein [Frankia]
MNPSVLLGHRHDDRGHRTSRPVREVDPPEHGPTSVPARGWLAVAKRVKSQLAILSIPLIASGVAFWAILSIFPAAIAVLTVYGLVASPQTVSNQIADLSDSLSPSTSAVLRDWLNGIVSTNHSGLGLGLLLSLAGVLWAVSSGTQNLIKAVTVAFEQEETRGPVRLRGLAVAMSLGGVVVAVLIVGGITAGGSLLSHHVADGTVRVVLTVVQWLVLAMIVMAAVATLYRFGPAHTPANWRWASVGAVVATVALIVASVAFSFYVRAFGHYNKTYGALGGVVILMLWLYYAVTVVLIGALLNAEAAREATGATAPETYPEASPVGVRRPWDRPEADDEAETEAETDRDGETATDRPAGAAERIRTGIRFRRRERRG